MTFIESLLAVVMVLGLVTIIGLIGLREGVKRVVVKIFLSFLVLAIPMVLAREIFNIGFSRYTEGRFFWGLLTIGFSLYAFRKGYFKISEPAPNPEKKRLLTSKHVMVLGLVLLAVGLLVQLPGGGAVFAFGLLATCMGGLKAFVFKTKNGPSVWMSIMSTIFILILVRNTILGVYVVKNIAMEPTYQSGDLMFVSPLLRKPKVGDVIVYRNDALTKKIGFHRVVEPVSDRSTVLPDYYAIEGDNPEVNDGKGTRGLVHKSKVRGTVIGSYRPPIKGFTNSNPTVPDIGVTGKN